VKQIHKRLTYANVMSTIAVFLVLGGASALAASQLGKNSVGSKQLKKNAVTAAKIKNNAVTSAKIKNGAVSGAKINVGSLGTVPSATNATNATNAGNANTVGGMTVSKISYVAKSGSGPQTILDTQGLVLTASCSGVGHPLVIAKAVGVPGGVGVEFNTDESEGSANSVISDDGTDGIFTTGQEIVTVRERGTFLFQRSDGHVVSGIFGSDLTAAMHDVNGGSISDCAFGATITAG
jgi:hypothetical protein